jgi:hypothetical protein
MHTVWFGRFLYVFVLMFNRWQTHCHGFLCRWVLNGSAIEKRLSHFGRVHPALLAIIFLVAPPHTRGRCCAVPWGRCEICASAHVFCPIFIRGCRSFADIYDVLLPAKENQRELTLGCTLSRGGSHNSCALAGWCPHRSEVPGSPNMAFTRSPAIGRKPMVTAETHMLPYNVW